MNNKKQNVCQENLNSDQNVLEKAFEHYQKNDYEKAEHFFALALEEYDNAEIHYYRGKSFLNLGKPLAAVGCFERAKETAPENQDIYIDGINALLQLNFPDRALKWIEDAMQLKTKSKKLFALKVRWFHRKALQSEIRFFIINRNDKRSNILKCNAWRFG